MNEFRTFGVDRISELKILEETFNPGGKSDPTELFENIIGLTYNLEKLEEVILSFTTLQGKYIKTLPLHRSQEIITDNNEEFRIRLRIIPNYEFKQKILMHADTVKVIKPKWLVDEIKESLRESLNNYK